MGNGFFDALRTGQFDAVAVCSKLDAMRASATVEADKTMITGRIQKEVGMQSYNDRLRQFLEQQYRLVAMKAREGKSEPRQYGGGGHADGRDDHAGAASGAAGFAELLTHIRRLGDQQAEIKAQLARLEAASRGAAGVIAPSAGD